MSYHDGYDPSREGISVVNPLIRIERKFEQIRQLLVDVEEEIDGLSAEDLKRLIQEILDE